MEKLEKIDKLYRYCILVLKNRFNKISADTLGWLTNIALHCVTLPTFLALMTGMSDKTPPVDIVMLLWTALALLFFRAVVLRDLLNIITIGLGFIAQAVIMAMILFK